MSNGALCATSTASRANSRKLGRTASMRGAVATIDDVMPVSRATKAGTGTPGSTSVWNSPSTSPPRTFTAPISVIPAPAGSRRSSRGRRRRTSPRAAACPGPPAWAGRGRPAVRTRRGGGEGGSGRHGGEASEGHRHHRREVRRPPADTRAGPRSGSPGGIGWERENRDDHGRSARGDPWTRCGGGAAHGGRRTGGRPARGAGRAAVGPEPARGRRGRRAGRARHGPGPGRAPAGAGLRASSARDGGRGAPVACPGRRRGVPARGRRGLVPRARERAGARLRATGRPVPGTGA